MNKKQIEILNFLDNNPLMMHFHDVVYEATNISYTDIELKRFFNMLPESIQEIALEWTMADTEFREFALKFLKTAPVNIRRPQESLIQR